MPNYLWRESREDWIGRASICREALRKAQSSQWGAPEQRLPITGNCTRQERPDVLSHSLAGSTWESATSEWMLRRILRLRGRRLRLITFLTVALPCRESWVECCPHTSISTYHIQSHLTSLPCWIISLRSQSKCWGSLGMHLLPIPYIFPYRNSFQSMISNSTSPNIDADSVCQTIIFSNLGHWKGSSNYFPILSHLASCLQFIHHMCLVGYFQDPNKIMLLCAENSSIAPLCS